MYSTFSTIFSLLLAPPWNAHWSCPKKFSGGGVFWGSIADNNKPNLMLRSYMGLYHIGRAFRALDRILSAKVYYYLNPKI